MSSPESQFVVHSPLPSQRARPSLSAFSLFALPALLASLLAATSAHAVLPPWLQHVFGASTVESALFRLMPLPGAAAGRQTDILYPRPPKEAQGELARLSIAAPEQGELYALRARADEQALDFSSAEGNWKSYAAHPHPKDPGAAKLELANFYHRRMQIPQELATLFEVAALLASASESRLPPEQQRTYAVFERMLALAPDQDLPPSQISGIYQLFLSHYPTQRALYESYLNFLLAHNDTAAAESAIARYRVAVPSDLVFPLRAEAEIATHRGDYSAALAVYDRAFSPLASPELMESYFALLTKTHRLRAFVADARTRLAAHPDGPDALNALARIFFYDQQAGRLEAAEQTLNNFRMAREARGGAWTPDDLNTLATLTSAIKAYPEAARYFFALASSPGAIAGGEPAAQAGLAGLAHALLTAPDAPIALGAGNLTLYRDIATLDSGPGYWNGILSLWLNGTSPDREYADETGKAQTYFHRAKAADLLAQLDSKFPAAPERASLHAELIHAEADYGEPDAVIAHGSAFLQSFPASRDRIEVAGLIADAYARKGDTRSEFALYESLLAELAASSHGLPLSSTLPTADLPKHTLGVILHQGSATYGDAASVSAGTVEKLIPEDASAPVASPAPNTPYARILDRYLGRLTATGQLPLALTVLRRQLDRNPDDPLLYERLATFLQQNNLTAQQEEVFQLAIARFGGASWYDKLARLYLRERKREAFATLTRQVTRIFSGTDLDAFFLRNAKLNPKDAGGPALALQLNLYAAERFPHDLVFTRNLLAAYQTRPTANAAAYEELLRRTWWSADDLRDGFFAYLSRTGQLDKELAALARLAGPDAAASPASATPFNPAASRELGELHLWTSHFESAAPLLLSLSEAYPADPDLGDRTVSLFRSLSYSDETPTSLLHAVTVEQRLLSADPDSPGRLATLGDLYAEATATGGEDLASAAPFWRRIPALHPGSTAGFLTSATIFWDYFQFDDALRQITSARTHAGAPALFGYEAGAIAENRGDLPAAVAEYVNTVVHPLAASLKTDSATGVVDAFARPPSDAADSNLISAAQSFVGAPESTARLLTLAVRPPTSALVDKASAAASAQSAVSLPALNLRIAVLSAQKRESELPALFNSTLARTKDPEQLAAIGALAGEHMLPLVYEHALELQAALTLDPVEKLELNYTLARSLESRKQIAAATHVIDTAYRANPRILGVVRATADFYVRTSQRPLAIATLLEAGRAATPELARDFTLEAAGLANQDGNPAQARSLADPLLAKTPYDAKVLAVIADSFARAHDDVGLKAFYTAQLEAARTAGGLSRDERRADIALLRRGLIPALTRLHENEAALDQYIALLSAYPEDSSTANEAALYALQHDRQSQLLDFFRATIKSSPRDSRFAILFAETETTFEDLPAAVSAYDAAIAIRSDRSDLYEARLALEMRLRQFDPAAHDLQRLYELTYKDPQWMVRLGELRARQQRPADAVKALQTAYLTGHPAEAGDAFKVAALLEKWNLLAEAETFAERGRALAKDQLLLQRDSASASTYARVLTRAGKADQVLAILTSARKAAAISATSPSTLAAEVARAEISADEAAGFRRNFSEERQRLADKQLNAAVQAMGSAVDTFYTPEQKVQYAHQLDTLHSSNPALALAAATSSGLADREALWRRQQLLTGPVASADPAPYIALQRRRLAFLELAQTLEAYAARLAPKDRRPFREQAAGNFRDAGDTSDELRLTRSVVLADSTQLQTRFFDLLLRHDRPALAALAGSRNTTLAEAALDYTLSHGDEADTLHAIAERGRTLPAVWQPASAALVGLYFLPRDASASAGSSAATAARFVEALHPQATIATRLASPADPARQLTGQSWFFSASRFGILLENTHAPAFEPEDFLPAQLEEAPGTPGGYVDLARTYAEASRISEATAEYQHALELSPEDPGLHEELAVLLYRSGHHPEATEQWRSALRLLAIHQSGENFFTVFSVLTHHLGQRALTASLRPEIESVLRPYLSHNGNYRSNELLRDIYDASATPSAGAAFIVSVSASAPDPNLPLEDLRRVPWLSSEAHETILLHQIELARAHINGAPDSGPAALLRYQSALLDLYLDTNQLPKARALLNSVPPSQDRSTLEIDRVILATRTRDLQPLLDAWRADPDATPAQSTLTSALFLLKRPTSNYHPDSAAIRPLEDFLFESKQRAGALRPTDFLSLAQIRLDTGDLPGAVLLLHRLTLQPTSASEIREISAPDAGSGTDAFVANGSGNEENNDTPYRNTDHAAALLVEAHHPAEAIPFLSALVDAEPWNADYRLRLADTTEASGDRTHAAEQFSALVADQTAPYAIRTDSASRLNRASLRFATAPPQTSELNLLVAGLRTPAASEQARKPYFVAARIALATEASTPPALRSSLLREAINIAPEGSASDRARLALLLNELDRPDPAPALAVLRSLERSPAIRSAPSDDPSSPDDTDADTAGDASDSGAGTDAEAFADTSAAQPGSNAGSTALPSIASTLDLPARIHLAGLVASAYERENDVASALAYLQLGLQLAGQQEETSSNTTPGAASQNALRDRLRTLKAAQDLEAKNAARRPHLRADLPSSIAVRPRLTAAELARAEAP